MKRLDVVVYFHGFIVMMTFFDEDMYSRWNVVFHQFSLAMGPHRKVDKSVVFVTMILRVDNVVVFSQ